MVRNVEHTGSRPHKSLSVTVIGLTTLILGVAYAALGGTIVVAYVKEVTQDSRSGGGELGGVFMLLEVFATMIGVGIFVIGVLGMVASTGILLRKQWGRISTFCLAVPTTMLGLYSLSFSVNTFRDGDFWSGILALALGAALILYGILTIVILLIRGSEFSWPQSWNIREKQSSEVQGVQTESVTLADRPRE